MTTADGRPGGQQVLSAVGQGLGFQKAHGLPQNSTAELPLF